MFNEYIKNEHIIKATNRAYEILYKPKGYVPYEKVPKIGDEFIEDIEQAHKLAIKEDYRRELEGAKVDDLRELAKDKQIEGYSKMKKEELVAALVGD